MARWLVSARIHGGPAQSPALCADTDCLLVFSRCFFFLPRLSPLVINIQYPILPRMRPASSLSRMSWLVLLPFYQ